MDYDLRNPIDREKAKIIFESLIFKKRKISLIEKREQRTIRQNSAIHLYCQMVADELNNQGQTYVAFHDGWKHGLEVPFTGILVKETLWKPLQLALLSIESTTELSKFDINIIYDAINKYLGERFSIYLPFPSIENKEKLKKR